MHGTGKLEQFLDDIWYPVAFFSRKLTSSERKYNTFDCELLAIFLAVKQFHHHIEDCHTPSSLTINHSLFPSPLLPSVHPVRLATCYSSVSFLLMCAMSVENVMLSLTHSLCLIFLPSSTIISLFPIRPFQTKWLPVKLPSLAFDKTTSNLTTAVSL